MNNNGLMYNQSTIQQIDIEFNMSKIIEYTENNYSDFEWIAFNFHLKLISIKKHTV